MRVNANDVEHYYKLYGRNVISAALCYVKDPNDANDIAQDVFFRLYTYTGSFESDEHIKAWLIRCAVNRSKDLVRSPWQRRKLPLEAASDKLQYDSTDEGDSMLDILQKLGRNNRIALYMYYYEEYSVQEIADILGVSVNAVTLRLKRGRMQLKKLLDRK